MHALSAVLALSVAALWAGCASGDEMIYDTLQFLLGVVQEDEFWTKYLDAEVKVDAAVLTIAGRKVLEDLKIVPPTEADHSFASVPAVEGEQAQEGGGEEPGPDGGGEEPGPDGGGEEPGPDGDRAVTVTALRVVVEAVTRHDGESDALAFAMAVMASAVKCHVLPYILMQLRVIEAMAGQDCPENFDRPPAVWRNVVRYVDKVARLGDPLDTEGRMYRAWGQTVRQTLRPTLDVAAGAMGDVRPFKKLAEDAVADACAAGAYERAETRAALDPDVDRWTTAAGALSIFDKAQRAFDAALDDMPFGTMDLTLWSDYLNNPDILNVPKSGGGFYLV